MTDADRDEFLDAVHHARAALDRLKAAHDAGDEVTVGVEVETASDMIDALAMLLTIQAEPLEL